MRMLLFLSFLVQPHTFRLSSRCSSPAMVRPRCIYVNPPQLSTLATARRALHTCTI